MLARYRVDDVVPRGRELSAVEVAAVAGADLGFNWVGANFYANSFVGPGGQMFGESNPNLMANGQYFTYQNWAPDVWGIGPYIVWYDSAGNAGYYNASKADQES